MTWQPIETAPKDGNDWLIGWQPDEFGDPKWEKPLPMVWFADYCWATPDEGQTGGGKEIAVAEGLYRFNPTHWMPLPNPPSPESDA